MRWKLLQWQKENGHTGRFIARKIGCSDSAYSKIVKGTQNPTLEQIEAFRREFGLENILDLLQGADDETEV